MEHLIIGLDPGSTIGYSVLDLDGNLIEIGSIRGKLDDVIRKVSEIGKVVAVGTDVKNIPKFVEKFSARMNTKIIVPENDLLYMRKKRMTKEFLKFKNVRLKNKHEMDALASALFAYKSFKGLFNKIDNEVKDEGMSSKIKELVLVEEIPIKKALSKL